MHQKIITVQERLQRKFESTTPHCRHRRCSPDWADKLEQRLAAAAAISGGSHVVGSWGADSAVTDERGNVDQAAAAQPDPDAALLVDRHGFVLALPNPLRVRLHGHAADACNLCAAKLLVNSDSSQLRVGRFVMQLKMTFKNPNVGCRHLAVGKHHVNAMPRSRPSQRAWCLPDSVFPYAASDESAADTLDD